MADEELFMGYPRLLDPEHSERKMELGKFADTLSKRSLSTSTPCVRRNVSAVKVENDSGYADSLEDSMWSSANTTISYDEVDMNGTSENDSGKMFMTPSAVRTSFRTPSVIQTTAFMTPSVVQPPTLSFTSAGPPSPKINIELYSESLNIPADWNNVDDESMVTYDAESLRKNVRHSNVSSRLSRVEEDSMTDCPMVNSASFFHTSSLDDRFAEILTHFMPQEPDRLIGRKMLLKNVDIISELDSRNLNFSCVSIILGYLEPEDLCRMCQVNLQWRKACLSDPAANRRRRHFLSQQKPSLSNGKENCVQKRSMRKSRQLTTSGSTSPLKSMQALGSTPMETETNHVPFPPIHKHNEKSQLYEMAAKSLQNDESLCSCKKCNQPARVNPTQQRAKCFNKLCLFDFCVKCWSDFHGSSSCVPVAFKKLKTGTIGSKKSKNNLRRLGR